MTNITVLSNWTTAKRTYQLVYSAGAARHNKPAYGVIRVKDGALLAQVDSELDAKGVLYDLGATYC